MGCFREFVLSSARALGSPVTDDSVAPRCSALTRSVLRGTCRSMRNHFKVVQAQYFLKQYEKESQQEIPAALESLHSAGEICYFRSKTGDTNADLVILDPAWLVESVNFVLRNGYNRFSTTSVFGDSSDCLSQSFQEEIKILWKNRPRTKMGLELAEQISADAPDLVFDFLASLLAKHDVVVPMSLCKGSNEVFVPSQLSPRDFHEGCDSSCEVNCPLLHLGASNIFAHSVCHGLTFIERVPASLMERISVHVTKILDSQKEDALDIFIQEFHCWKDSWRIVLSLSDGDEDSTMDVQSFLLHAPDNDDTPCHAVSCKSMCVTCIRVSRTHSLGEASKQVCLSIRRAMQNALDEMPGVEYKDEGICPECLTKKSVGEIGSWTFPKIRSIIDDQESTIRCRNGHCVDIGFVQGLITCHLETPKPDFACCDSVCTEEAVSLDESGKSETSVENDSIPSDESRAESRSLGDVFRNIKPCDNPRRSKTEPSSVGSDVPSFVDLAFVPDTFVHDSLDVVDREKIEEVKKIIQAYESSTKKRFFGMKKAKLVLSGLQLREKHLLPLLELANTPLGSGIHHLSLSNNPLKTLPSSFAKAFPNLKSLDLSNCCLSELPSFWDTPKLKKLNLSNNRLRSFPEDEMLGGMLELEELNLSGNKIKKIQLPSNIQVFAKLKTLDLSANQICSLPKVMGRLCSLKVFDIHQNPIREVPVDIVSQMNGFFSEASNDASMKGKKIGRADNQRQKRSMWSSKGSSFGEYSSMEAAKRYNRRSGVKQVSLTRTTQNTVPIEDCSERCEFSVY